MLSLNMVIIASMIGAGGLGHDVLTSLRRLAIGDGLEAGIAITLLAIALDRLSQAFAAKPPPERRDPAAGFLKRHPHLAAAAAITAVTTALGIVVPPIQSFPEAWSLTTGPFWDALVKWININFFDQLEAVKTFLLLNVLIPFKRFLLAIPWPAVICMLALAGWQLGGARLAALVAGLATFIVVTGNWEKAMISTYLVGISVAFASLIGMPIGIWAASNERVHRVVQVAIDTLQTLPAFVYLIPVVMLFRVGDFSAMIAVVMYSLVPAIRYTDHGIRQVPPSIIEAATAAGCNRWQRLWKVELRLALPEIMLGVNQTIMFGLSMLVITALVGTRDLGQEVYIALTKADTGRGLVAGACVAFIAMISDRLISAWSRQAVPSYTAEVVPFCSAIDTPADPRAGSRQVGVGPAFFHVALFESRKSLHTGSAGRTRGKPSSVPDLPPKTWPRRNVSLGPLERRSRCHGSDIPRNRSSASCVRLKSAWRAVTRCPKCAGPWASPSRRTIGGARSTAA